MHFLARFLAVGLLATIGLAAAAPAITTAELWDKFVTPAADTRPFVRWWWNGGRVEEREILRQLDVLRDAGIGGVEINMIAMPTISAETKLAAHPEVAWRSEEWCRLVRVAAEGARARGMSADLLVGSGWPFGGEFLPVEQQTQRVRLVTRTIEGPQTLELDTAELIRPVQEPKARARDERDPSRAELLFLRVVPEAAKAGPFSPGQELVTAPTPARITVNVGAGKHTLYIGVREWGFTHVKLGAPGASGPVVNHYDAAAVRAYFEFMVERLAPALGGRLGNHLRALFVDSLELDHANWTSDFPEEFARRRGYDPLPFLPFALEPEQPGVESEFVRTVRRARHDVSLTLVELFEERFLATFTAFCREQGVLSRVQAYGRETHPIHGGLAVDLPEGETWLWHDRADPLVLRPESTVVNKYVSSAAHLGGKRIVSFEAMTNANAAFRELPSDFKAGLDASFLDGLNHPIFHGFNYTPPAAGFPGWVRFGSYLNERTPWWPAMRAVTDYVARIGTVLRNATAAGEIALLAPRSDEWARHGMLYQPFPEVRHPWYQYDLARAIQHAGWNCDFVSERVLQQASVRDGRLAFGPQAYSTVVLQEVDSIAPATLEALLRFVHAGGRVLVIERLPSRAAGLGPDLARDVRVRELAAELRTMGGERVRVVPAPIFVDARGQIATPPPARELDHGNRPAVEAFERMIAWADEHLTQLGVRARVRLAPLSGEVAQVHHRTADADVFFVANLSTKRPVAQRLTLPGGEGELWRWDPETGRRDRVAGDPARGLELELRPQQSLMLVRTPKRDSAVGGPAISLAGDGAAGSARTLTGEWTAEFVPADGSATFTRKLDALADLARVAGVPELNRFGGTIRYTIEFDAAAAGPARLDLGRVYGVSDVSLNGQALGRRWYGEHVFSTEGALGSGRNKLVVTVRTHLGNAMREKRGDPAAQRWAHWYPPIPTGLVGPVTLSTPEQRDAVLSSTAGPR